MTLAQQHDCGRWLPRCERPSQSDCEGLSDYVVLAQVKSNTLRHSSTPSGRPIRTRPTRVRVTNELRRQVTARYQAGAVSAQTCADEFDISKGTVLRILKEAGVAVRPQGRRIT